MFFSGTPSLILMTYPFYLLIGIPRIIIPFNLIIAGLLVYYLYLKFKYFIALGRLDNDTEKYVSIWEWIPFISMYVWFFVVNTILIIGHMT